MDKGPWIATPGTGTLQSDDFNFDVALKISGDFGDDSVRDAYAQWLATRLNTTPPPGSLSEEYIHTLATELAEIASRLEGPRLVSAFVRTLSHAFHEKSSNDTGVL